MSLAACKEEENNNTQNSMAVLMGRQKLFESYMRQELTSDREIQFARDIDAPVQAVLDKACDQYEELNHRIATRD